MSDLVIPGNSPACNRSEYCHKKIPSTKRWDILVSMAGPLVEGGSADWLQSDNNCTPDHRFMQTFYQSNNFLYVPLTVYPEPEIIITR